MKRVLHVIVFLMALLPLSMEARTAADFFVDAPLRQMLLLDRNTRLDMLDYFNIGMATTSTNTLNGRSKIVRNEPQLLVVETSASSAMQIALVKVKSDTLIAVIETVKTPVPDSSIRFYKSDWTLAKTQPDMPTYKSFITKDKKTVAKTATEPDMIFYTIDFDAERGEFVFLNTTTGYYVVADRPDGVDLMSPSIIMRYDGKKFVDVTR